MCGIFGIVAKTNKVPSSVLKGIIKNLYLYSESRGKEAAGAAFKFNGSIEIYKRATCASNMLKDKEFAALEHRFLQSPESVKAFIGHSRLVTNGSQDNQRNNQPVVSEGIAGVHNGIIVNQDALWKSHPELQQKYEVDTEVLFSLIGVATKQTNSLIQGTEHAFNEIRGNASIAIFSSHLPYMLLATNNGSLYLSICDNFILFTSEKYILDKVLLKFKGSDVLTTRSFQIRPNQSYLVNTTNLNLISSAEQRNQPMQLQEEAIVEIIDRSPQEKQMLKANVHYTPNYAPLQAHYELVRHRVSSLKRCCTCLLPETMPFIVYDDKGECNFCKHHSKIKIQGTDKLFETVEPYRKKGNAPDIVLGASGGRDSTYALHYAKEVLDLNPIAYTYDWGMVTDLARRNVARITGQLGIEHILISADIAKKRRYIRKNVEAWLRNPHLGLIPLFMAGDKQYFYYLNQVMKQNNIDITLYAENQLEKTHFKTGFCNIEEGFGTIYYDISLFKKLQLPLFYLKHFIINPAYLNESMLDTISAFFSAYFIKHDYIFLYHYIPWDEKEINKTLMDTYDWELSPDTKTTWRIGDGTAAFYNYIYYIMSGLTENDTLRSNQIREGYLSRDEALKMVEDENQPRWESIQWYCDTIHVDMEQAILRINNAPKQFAL